MAAVVPRTRLGARAKIGLLADTHCHQPGAGDLPGAVLDVFRGVDVVVHLGDMGEADVLDRLSTVADVVATRGRDDPPEDPRIAPFARVIEGGGLVVGALFDLAIAGLASSEGDHLGFAALSPEQLARVFGQRVDVVTFGATHRELVAFHQGILLVNPGSATLPARPRVGTMGTVAVLELGAAVASVEIVTVGAPR
jgi:putative phosphoesterase